MDTLFLWMFLRSYFKLNYIAAWCVCMNINVNLAEKWDIDDCTSNLLLIPNAEITSIFWDGSKFFNYLLYYLLIIEITKF